MSCCVEERTDELGGEEKGYVVSRRQGAACRLRKGKCSKAGDGINIGRPTPLPGSHILANTA